MSDRDAIVDVAWNPRATRRGRRSGGLEDQARALHHALKGYAPTPLHRAPTLAASWDSGAVLLKDESSRFGLPAFKALGAWWATAWAWPTAWARPHWPPSPRRCATTCAARR